MLNNGDLTKRTVAAEKSKKSASSPSYRERGGFLNNMSVYASRTGERGLFQLTEDCVLSYKHNPENPLNLQPDDQGTLMGYRSSLAEFLHDTCVSRPVADRMKLILNIEQILDPEQGNKKARYLLRHLTRKTPTLRGYANALTFMAGSQQESSQEKTKRYYLWNGFEDGFYKAFSGNMPNFTGLLVGNNYFDLSQAVQAVKRGEQVFNVQEGENFYASTIGRLLGNVEAGIMHLRRNGTYRNRVATANDQKVEECVLSAAYILEQQMLSRAEQGDCIAQVTLENLSRIDHQIDAYLDKKYMKDSE